MNVTHKERLDFWTCFFLNSQSHYVSLNFVSASPTNFNTSFEIQTTNTHIEEHGEVHNYFCKANGASITGNQEAGRVLCLLLCLLIFVTGVVGLCTNILNILLLRKSFTAKGAISFKNSLVLLAVIELVLCFGTTGFSLFTVLIMGKKYEFYL